MASDYISEHFKASEFVVTNTGLPNILPDDLIVNRDLLCTQLQVLRDFIGKPIIINSAFRSPAVNKAVGGATHSAHLECRAADIRCPGLSYNDFLCSILNSPAAFSRIILEPFWFHVEIDYGNHDLFNELRRVELPDSSGFPGSFTVYYLLNTRTMINLSKR
ncbi:hypothetical protein [Dipodfec virus UA23Rod_920]|uniref:Peptidase M15A C-terminal domain-containing protein n=1 Tax=Dipodfec virus UA23Rod_920 TaxID=2929334 RepID=A0A976R5G1_9VIRU|nr:hypothetical protein [Dipodfec virus UA23Rod_920]